jgi:hypothetical protein
MNYLLAGTLAPTYKDELGIPEIFVTWRLIWEDTRYRDGTIPEEETQYLAPPLAASVVSPHPGEPLRAVPGDIVPKTGWWHTPALQGEAGSRYFKEGERFPDRQLSSWGKIIWTYDPERQAGDGRSEDGK